MSELAKEMAPRVTESQRKGQSGGDLLGPFGPMPLLEQGWLQQVAQGCVQSGFGYL